MKIKDVKLGDEIYLPLDKNGRLTTSFTGSTAQVTATLIRENGDDSIIGWKDKLTMSNNSWMIFETDQCLPGYVRGMYVALDHECKLVIPKPPQLMPKLDAEAIKFDPVMRKLVNQHVVSRDSFGFLLACIGVGAGVSNYTKTLIATTMPKEKALVARK